MAATTLVTTMYNFDLFPLQKLFAQYILWTKNKLGKLFADERQVLAQEIVQRQCPQADSEQELVGDVLVCALEEADFVVAHHMLNNMGLTQNGVVATCNACGNAGHVKWILQNVSNLDDNMFIRLLRSFAVENENLDMVKAVLSVSERVSPMNRRGRTRIATIHAHMFTRMGDSACCAIAVELSRYSWA